MLLKDQTALVTGGGRGIGRAIVKALAGAGAKVAFVYRSGQESADSLVQEVTSDGGVASAIQGDVGEPTCAAKVVEKVIGDWGRLDILVNNAGIIRDGLFVRMNDADWDAVMGLDRGPGPVHHINPIDDIRLEAAEEPRAMPKPAHASIGRTPVCSHHGCSSSRILRTEAAGPRLPPVMLL